jgi:hypothetical protein
MGTAEVKMYMYRQLIQVGGGQLYEMGRAGGAQKQLG